MSTSPFIMAVGPSVPSRTIAEFIAYAKANPGKLNFAAPTGSPPHLGGEMFKAATGTDMVPVSYRTMNQAFIDLVAGQIDVIFDAPAILLPLIQNGSVRALALLANERAPLIPDLPTADEQGFANVLMENWYGLLVPAGVPSQQQAILEKTALEAVKVPSVKERLDAGGVRGMRDRAAFKSKIDGDFAYWRTTIKQLGITAD